MSDDSNMTAKPEPTDEEFKASMEKIAKRAKHIVDEMEPDRVRQLCINFLIFAMASYKHLDEESEMLGVFDSILNTVKIKFVNVDGKEESHD